MATDSTMGPQLESQFEVTVQITRRIAGKDETKTLGVFDKFTGGEIDSEEKTYHPGGMAEPEQAGGKKKVGNVVITRATRLDRDSALKQWIIDGVGKAKATAFKKELDEEGNAYGRPLVYRGRLKRYAPPEHDSESDDLANYEIEISSATVTS